MSAYKELDLARQNSEMDEHCTCGHSREAHGGDGCWDLERDQRADCACESFDSSRTATSQLMTELHSVRADHYPTCDRMTIYQPLNLPARHIQNALDHLKLFILPDVTDHLSYEYITLQLQLAIRKLPKETGR